MMKAKQCAVTTFLALGSAIGVEVQSAIAQESRGTIAWVNSGESVVTVALELGGARTRCGFPYFKINRGSGKF